MATPSQMTQTESIERAADEAMGVPTRCEMDGCGSASFAVVSVGRRVFLGGASYSNGRFKEVQRACLCRSHAERATAAYGRQVASVRKLF